MGLFDVNEARATLAELLPVLDEIVALRAQAAELSTDLATSAGPTEHGGLPELKGMHARLDELMTKVQESGAELKGFAPLLLDFPADLDDGTPIYLCWLEGDRDLTWYHRQDCGFAGRRPLP